MNKSMLYTINDLPKFSTLAYVQSEIAEKLLEYRIVPLKELKDCTTSGSIDCVRAAIRQLRIKFQRRKITIYSVHGLGFTLYKGLASPHDLTTKEEQIYKLLEKARNRGEKTTLTEMSRVIYGDELGARNIGVFISKMRKKEIPISRDISERFARFALGEAA